MRAPDWMKLGRVRRTGPRAATVDVAISEDAIVLLREIVEELRRQNDKVGVVGEQAALDMLTGVLSGRIGRRGDGPSGTVSTA